MRGSGGSTPSVIANVFAMSAKNMLWLPQMTARLAKRSVCASKVMRPIVIPGMATVNPAMPNTTRISPGIRKSRRGVHIRKKRSVRHPSRNVLDAAGDSCGRRGAG